MTKKNPGKKSFFIPFLISFGGLFLLFFPALGADVTPAAACEPRALLPQIREHFRDQAIQVHCITIAEDYVVSFYIVDSGLDPDARGDELALQARRAVIKSLKLILGVFTKFPCIGEEFSAINPMVVDRSYNVWYIDIIPVKVFKSLGSTEADDEAILSAAQRNSAEYHYKRNQRVPVPGPQPAGDFTDWENIFPTLLDVIADKPERIDIAAYYLIFNHERLVQVYWEALGDRETDEATVLAKVQRIKGALSRLWPRPDTLEIYITDPAGRTRLFANVRTNLLQKPGPIATNEFILQRLY